MRGEKRRGRTQEVGGGRRGGEGEGGGKEEKDGGRGGGRQRRKQRRKERWREGGEEKGQEKKAITEVSLCARHCTENLEIISFCFYNNPAAAAAAKSLQLFPTLCDPIDGSPPGSPILGSLQARTLEWVAISFSNA